MQRDDSVYLKHIRDAIHKIEGYTKRVSASSFQKETLVQDAVIRPIEIIGEATERLSEQTREGNQDIPCDDIEKVWLTVQKDIPILKKQISFILKNL